MTLIYLGVLLELGILTELGFIEFGERIQMYFQSICLRLKRVASNSLSSVHSPISPNKTFQHEEVWRPSLQPRSTSVCKYVCVA